MSVEFSNGILSLIDHVYDYNCSCLLESLSVEEAENLGASLLLWVAEQREELITFSEFMEREKLEHSPFLKTEEGESYPIIRLITQPERATIEGWYGWICKEAGGIDSIRKKKNK